MDRLFVEFPEFEKGRQEDSHELLMKILDKLHTETKLERKQKKDLKREKNVSVKKLWQNHLANHESVTSHVFEGLQKVTINCSGCKKNFVKHEIYS